MSDEEQLAEYRTGAIRFTFAEEIQEGRCGLSVAVRERNISVSTVS
jgi:hypothetical protein